MLKAILFDMDGVIVDTEPLHKKAYYMMFDTYNIEMTDSLYESFTGKSTKNTRAPYWSIILDFRLLLWSLNTAKETFLMAYLKLTKASNY
jgi:phosphoglycolate phosphatase-like HAD superfamily hydrolase